MLAEVRGVMVAGKLVHTGETAGTGCGTESCPWMPRRMLEARRVLAFDAYLVGLVLFALMPALLNGAMGSRRYRRSSRRRAA